jgi:hypothetical protein
MHFNTYIVNKNTELNGGSRVDPFYTKKAISVTGREDK